MLNTFLGVFIAPRAAFAAIRDANTPFWPPLLVLVAAALLLMGLYAANVDVEFMIDDTIANMGEVTVEQEEMTRQGLAAMGRFGMVFGAVASAVGVALTLVLSGLYLWLVGKATGTESAYRVSLSLASWAFLPTLVGSLVGIILILTAGEGRIPLTSVSPLNLANLLGLQGSALAAPLGAFDLTYLWTMALVTIGYREWHGVSTGKAAAIAVAPFAVLFGLWMVFGAM